MSSPAHSHASGHDHEVTISVSIAQAVDPPEREPSFCETVRDGHRKRIYESLEPQHYFHVEYQLLPDSQGGRVDRTDVVTFGVVSKVFTTQDSRVLKCWEEDGLSYFGWRHKHSFKVNKALLLDLYDHTLEVRVWNMKEKLSARARYDRPKAFRLPAPARRKDTPQMNEEEEELVVKERPIKFPAVNHSRTRMSKMGRGRSKRSNLNLSAELDSDDLGASVMEITSPMSPTKPPVLLEGPDDRGKMAAGDSVGTFSSALVPLPDHTSLSLVTSPLPGLSKRRLKKLEAEAAEQARIEREGIAVLTLRLSDLFAKRTSTSTEMTSPVKNLKGFEVDVSLESSLMPEGLLRILNPMTVTVGVVTGLPDTPTSREELEEKCEPVYVKYKFHHQPEYRTPGRPHTTVTSWGDSHMILLGTIGKELLTEYLRGPPLVMEVHDRDRRVEPVRDPAVFGEEDRDEVLGTHAFGTGLTRSSEAARGNFRPWDPYGIAQLNLSGLLLGQRMLELTVPVTNGPRGPGRGEEDMRVGPLGGALPDPFPPGDYLLSQSELTVTIELTFPLTPPCSPPTPSHLTIKALEKTPSRAPSRVPSRVRDQADGVIKSPSKALKRREMTIPKCPFGRLVYMVSSEGESMVQKVLSLVNEINASALGLQDLPSDVLPAALSTYKLTNSQISGVECDVVSGFHVEDWEQHIIVLEALNDKGLRRIWEQLPHHATQAKGLTKVFYNSDFTFSQRLYGTLDVDLPRIRLYQPLSELVQQSVIYIQDSIPRLCFRALMCLNELSVVSEMGDVTRNGLFPTAEEVAALSLQFAVPAGLEEADMGRDSLSGEGPPARPQTPDLLDRHQSRREVWEPLDLWNREFLSHLRTRRSMPDKDFLKMNILHSHALSERSGQRRSKKKRVRSLSESAITTGREEKVHNYSIQTLNSTEQAKGRLRERLARDPSHRYTYCQHYHSMTVVPIDVEAEQRAKRLEAARKWQTKEGFVYPGISDARESNVHVNKPDLTRIQDLEEAFEDNLLHTSTLKPTVDRLHFSWERRSDDFERYCPPPPTYGPPPPTTIHLAGESRKRELQDSQTQENEVWRSKVVVSDNQFHIHRKGVQTELNLSGRKASTQLDKLKGILKDPPQKHSLRQDGLRFDEVPALNVVHNPSVDSQLNVLVVNGRGEDGSNAGYHPGPFEGRSLRLNSNVIPLDGGRSKGDDSLRKLHLEDFRLHYHVPSVLSKRPILPLTSNEKSEGLKLTAATTVSPMKH